LPLSGQVLRFLGQVLRFLGQVLRFSGQVLRFSGQVLRFFKGAFVQQFLQWKSNIFESNIFDVIYLTAIG